MLENPELLILPWKLAPPASDRAVRRVFDPATGSQLGFVACSTKNLPLFGWCQGHRLQVFEGPDASLLMSARRPWGIFRMWRVHDADERYVGACYHGYLFDGVGYFFAYAEQEEAGHFYTRARVPLGSWHNLADGTVRLVFTPCPESSPFARMILLARVLSEQPCP